MYYIHMGGIVLKQEDGSLVQDLRKKISLEFEGIVVSNKVVYMYRDFEWHEMGRKYLWVTDHKRVDCYQVFFRMGGSRLVPIDECVVIE